MTEFKWLASQCFWLLWFVPVFVVILIYRRIKIKKAAEIFWGVKPKTTAPQILKIVIFALAITCIPFSLARPVQSMRKTETEISGRDAIFLIDVSRSMTAEDIKPNRLSQSVMAIADDLESLKTSRVGLMAFAGTSVLLCPLTYDYEYFMQTLGSLDTGSVSRGGSMAGDAFRKIENEILKPGISANADIILITDGEDQESFPLEAAAKLADYNAKLLIIATGDDKQGARVPIYNQDGTKSFLVYDNKEVWSVANTDLLKRLAQAVPGSAFVSITEGTFNFKNIYERFKSGAESSKRNIQDYQSAELFQLFVLPMVLLLAAVYVLGFGRKR